MLRDPQRTVRALEGVTGMFLCVSIPSLCWDRVGHEAGPPQCQTAGFRGSCQSPSQGRYLVYQLFSAFLLFSFQLILFILKFTK